MWQDDNTNFDEIARNFVEHKAFSVFCCSDPQIHFYAHRFSDVSKRGSAWVWCSSCMRFTHLDGFALPTMWENCKKIDPHKLCAVPDYLESQKNIIDDHNSKFSESNKLSLKDKMMNGDIELIYNNLSSDNNLGVLLAITAAVKNNIKIPEITELIKKHTNNNNFEFCINISDLAYAALDILNVQKYSGNNKQILDLIERSISNDQY